jgi:tetrahydromethanopterin S-methyltransferase subunit G
MAGVYEWIVYATLTAVVVALAGGLLTALFRSQDRTNRVLERLGALERRVDGGFADVDRRFADVDRRFADVDQRFADVGQRFDELRIQMRIDKTEILERIDIVAQRLSRLEQGPG